MSSEAVALRPATHRGSGGWRLLPLPVLRIDVQWSPGSRVRGCQPCAHVTPEGRAWASAPHDVRLLCPPTPPRRTPQCRRSYCERRKMRLIADTLGTDDPCCERALACPWSDGSFLGPRVLVGCTFRLQRVSHQGLRTSAQATGSVKVLSYLGIGTARNPARQVLNEAREPTDYTKRSKLDVVWLCTKSGHAHLQIQSTSRTASWMRRPLGSRS